VQDKILQEVVVELSESLPGRFLGRIFQLSSLSLAIDFGLKEKGYLFLSVEPANPRLYLIKRAVRELEKASLPLTLFPQTMRATLSGGRLLSVTKDEHERVVRFSFEVTDEFGLSNTPVLIAQLTGRSANLFLLDAAGKVKQALRNPQGEGQQMGELYAPPRLQMKARAGKAVEQEISPGLAKGTISEALDNYYLALEVEEKFDTFAGNLLGRLKKEITKRRKLKSNLQKDLIAHGSPLEHKRIGDLLLANIANAERAGNKVVLKDYYSDETPTIEVEVDENETLQEAAAAYFSRYTKARRAVEEIGARLLQLDQELEGLVEKRGRLEAAIARRDAAALSEFEERKTPPVTEGRKQKASLTVPGMRRYRSSDGYEVIVGRTARDNDQLTFRVARPNDLWLHTADYPGSHVIVRNSSRDEIPHRTIIEAAQLAAKFSQASKDSKVAVHYTRRKFLTKPKGAASGLVRMSNFRTITVEPGENLERLK
jgi:predicted ribosome quality control (RQC) complex YloA/Tae2 family protein